MARARRGSAHARRHLAAAQPSVARESLSCAKNSWHRLAMRSSASSRTPEIFPSRAETLSAHRAAVGAAVGAAAGARVPRRVPSARPTATSSGMRPASGGIARRGRSLPASS